MRIHRIALAALWLLSACTHSPESRNVSSRPKSPEVVLFEEGLKEFEAEREARRPIISHEKHLPLVISQGHPTDYVVVLIHGLFESPFYMKGLTRNFQSRGCNVVAPLLAKHWAIPLEDLNKADYHEWIDDTLADVRRARKLGKKVLIGGHSTGGLLAVYIAILYPELVDGVMLWSPAVALSYPTYYGAFAGTLSNGWVNLDYNKLAGKPPADPEHVPYYSPLAGREVVRIEDDLLEKYIATHAFHDRPFWSVKRSLYSSVKVPVFLVNPAVDKVVYRAEIDLFWESLTSAKVRYDLQGEEHTSTPKDQDDYYPGAQTPNKDFPGMLEKLNRFLDENFPKPAPLPVDGG